MLGLSGVRLGWRVWFSLDGVSGIPALGSIQDIILDISYDGSLVHCRRQLSFHCTIDVFLQAHYILVSKEHVIIIGIVHSDVKLECLELSCVVLYCFSASRSFIAVLKSSTPNLFFTTKQNYAQFPRVGWFHRRLIRSN